MISFIVIGKNEGWKLKKCLDSIFLTIEKNCYGQSEVIYVDSRSSDDTLKLVEKYDLLRVFLVTGHTNAAISRNIGALESSFENLIFIDGDMEIQPSFLPLIIDASTGLKYNFCSGNWINYNYESFNSELLISKKIKKEMTSNQFEITTGGLFAIKRTIWLRFGGMNTSLNRSQDWDLALRLANEGILLFRLKEVFAIHHTISPHESVGKMWSMFQKGYRLYRIQIMRINYKNNHQWRHFLRINYTLPIFLASMISLYFSWLLPFYFYIGLIIIRSFKSHTRNFWIVLNAIFLYVLYDALLILGFIFFWPRNHELCYEKVQ